MIKRSLLWSVLILFGVACHAASIDGTSDIKYQSAHYVFRNGDSATGFVRLANGFTILPGASSPSTATLNIALPCAGGFDLQGTSTVTLWGDLRLDGNVTLSTGGCIEGKHTVLSLGGNLTLSANQILHLCGDLLIDGQGHDLFLNEHVQLMLDVGATVTIKNAIIHNKRNCFGWPSIVLAGDTARLTLSDVILALDSDFYINRGRLFINNDVAVTGTSALVWRSYSPCTIEPQSCLYFDTGTTFSYAPVTNNNGLIRMSDASSTLDFNGCSLLTTNTGMWLTQGSCFYDNKVTINCFACKHLNTTTPATTAIVNYKPTGLVLNDCCWSPDGRFIAGICGVNGAANRVEIHEFSSGTMNTAVKGSMLFASGDNGGGGSEWSPDGKYVALICNNGISSLQVFPVVDGVPGDPQRIITGLENPYYVRWSPDGRYLAVLSHTNDGTSDGFIGLYSCFGGKPVHIGNTDALVSNTSTLCWSPDGNYLAVVGGRGDGGYNGYLQFFSFTGSAFTRVTGVDIGVGTAPWGCSWSPDGKYIAVISQNKSVLNVVKVVNTSCSLLGTTAAIETTGGFIAWSPDGGYIGFIDCGNLKLKVCSFDQNTETLSSAVTVATFAEQHYSCRWSSDGKYLATAGQTSGYLNVYAMNFLAGQQQATLSNSILLGNSSAGSSSDVALKLFSEAQVGVTGLLSIDNVTATPDFADRNARFVLQNSLSKIKWNPSSVLGWKDDSVTRALSGRGEGDYNLYSYADGGGIVTYSAAPQRLVYSSNHAIRSLLKDVPQIYTTAVTIDEDTEIASLSVFESDIVVFAGVTLTLQSGCQINGAITLGHGATLKLSGNVTLGANAQITIDGTSASINGNNGTLRLSGTFTLSSSIQFTGDTTIDMGGNTLYIVTSEVLSPTRETSGNSIPAGVSVIFKGGRIVTGNPAAVTRDLTRLIEQTVNGTLIYDSVVIANTDDYSYVGTGSIEIYNDVVVVGPHTFSYQLTGGLIINSFSRLHFDHGTTFEYAPNGGSRTLLSMIDKTSVLSLNNCTLDLGSIGMRLTKGAVLFDNKVSIQSGTDSGHSFELGDGTISDNDVAVKVLGGARVEVDGYVYHNPVA